MPGAFLEVFRTYAAIGFEHDPICNWVFNNNNSAFFPFFSMLRRDLYLREGFGYTMSKGEGMALWVPPYNQKKTGAWTGLKSIGLMAWSAGLTGLKRGGALEKAMPPKSPDSLRFTSAAP
jgi:hypothetical protein